MSYLEILVELMKSFEVIVSQQFYIFSISNEILQMNLIKDGIFGEAVGWDA